MNSFGSLAAGEEMHSWARDLFPICRSITGEGVRQTLRYLQRILPRLKIESVPSGTPAYDWTVPDEWNIRDAFIEDECGKRVISFREHNLHVVGYSEPVDTWLSLDELNSRLHSLPAQPDAIPYVTSYYRRTWGFCLQHSRRVQLKPGRYRAVVDSSLAPGVMNYGELVLPGREPTEVLLSTYVCHPSMANNELSGPVVTTALARWLSEQSDRRHTYRILFLPETIGSIFYLSRHLQHLKKHCIAGFVVTCVGDERAFSLLPSRTGDTLTDRVARHTLRHRGANFTEYAFLDRGSDERQYCSVNVDLPVASVMRSKYWTYPEYHTSLDDLTLVTPAGLAGAFDLYRQMVTILENNWLLRASTTCEPFLQKHQLFTPNRTVRTDVGTRFLMNILAYADGKEDTVSLAEKIGAFAGDCALGIDVLHSAGLLARTSVMPNFTPRDNRR